LHPITPRHHSDTPTNNETKIEQQLFVEGDKKSIEGTNLSSSENGLKSPVKAPSSLELVNDMLSLVKDMEAKLFLRHRASSITPQKKIVPVL
jgi:hypothetical protein